MSICGDLILGNVLYDILGFSSLLGGMPVSWGTRHLLLDMLRMVMWWLGAR
jgi:hypothetical protein